MKTLTITVLIVSALGGSVAAAEAAGIPTALTMTAPSAVDLGEELVVEARLTTADGHPVAGVPLTLRQVGAVGERTMAEATTDAGGAASFVHREYTVAALTLKVAFAGNTSYGPSQAEVTVAIAGVEAKPAVVMSHAPGPLTKGILFGLLGSVWLTYLFAASRVVRVARDKGR